MNSDPGTSTRASTVEATVRSPRGGFLFGMFLAGVVATLLWQTLALSPMARLAALWVVIPTAGLLVIQLIRDWRAPPVDNRPSPAPEAGTTATRSGRFLRLGGWLGAVVVLIYVFGFLMAAPIYLAVYLRGEAGLGWRPSLSVAAVFGGLLYLVFARLVNVTLPIGLLG